MDQRIKAVVIAAAVTIAASAAPRAHGQDHGLSVTVTRAGAPAPNVQVDLQLLNRGKVAAGTTGAGGDLMMLMSLANLGKATRMQVVIYDCPNDQQLVVFVEAGAGMPEAKDCKRRIAGWFWFGRARAVLIDVTRGTVQVQGGQSFLSTPRGRLIAGGGAAALGVIALTAGGGDSNSAGNSPTGQSGTPGGTAFDPNGNYGVTNSVATDPGGHREFIAMENSTVLTLAVTGTTIRITCPPGSKWTLLTGTITNGQIAGEGRGPAAGFSNVLFRVAGTLATSGSSQGTLNLQLTVGAGGEFPGGQPTVYTVTGRKQ